MSFRETTSLLTNDTLDYKIRSRNLWKCNRKSIILSFCAGVIPLLLWIAIFQQTNDDPLQNPNQILQQQPPLLGLSSSLTRNGSKPLNSSSKDRSFKSSSKSTKTSTFTTVGNKTVATYNFVVTKDIQAPDNYLQTVLLINGQSPGPEIRIQQYSILIVHVSNKLDVPITFHYHGIHQRKSFLSDGVPNVTQNPIPPGGTFTYEFDTWPQVGTFFYHAHTGMDIVWLYGPLIIEDDPVVYKTLPEAYQTDDERVFILNGIYHEPLDELIDRVGGPVFKGLANTYSISVNGKSFGIWGNDTGVNGTESTSETTAGYDVTSVKKGLRYRFRFINAASDSLLSCRIASHTFTVIEADGIYVHPVATDHLIISPGQRYSLVITMDQEEENYYMSCKNMEFPGPRNGFAILHYMDAPDPSDEMRRLPIEGEETLALDRWVVEELTPNFELDQTDLYKVPHGVDKEFVIDVLEAKIVQKHVYLINEHYYEEPSVPYFMQLKRGLNISDPPQVFEILEGDVVQFVFQNQASGTFCYSHPWHIHGHSFHIVGEGPNRYDPVTDGQRIEEDVKNGKSFQFRDSVTVYGNQTIGEVTDGSFCGWAAVRFKANNPGIWLAHCHVTPHMIMGKLLVIWEHPEDDPQLTALMSQKIRG